jgi:uncharacterized membrane protein
VPQVCAFLPPRGDHWRLAAVAGSHFHVFFKQMLRIVTIVSAIAGLLNALYFTLAYYGRVRGSRWIPKVLCAPEGSSCVIVVRTAYGHILGPPNSLPGIFYYLAVIAWAVGEPWKTFRWYPAGHLFFVTVDFRMILLTLSLITLLVGAYLIYALRQILRVNCPLCYAAHVINVALFVALLAFRT